MKAIVLLSILTILSVSFQSRALDLSHRVYCPEVAITAATDKAWEHLQAGMDNKRSQIKAIQGGSREYRENGVSYITTYVLVNMGWSDAYAYRVKMHSLPTGNIACAVDSVEGAGFTVMTGP